MSATREDYPRLEQQIEWFDRNSARHQRWYRRLKVISIAAAALVPLVASLDEYAVFAGLLGVVLVIVEGLQHINQHHENWIRYRSTCENLRHEKYLYMAGAGSYEGQNDEQALRQLAARVESLLSRERDGWLQLRRSIGEQEGESSQSVSV